MRKWFRVNQNKLYRKYIFDPHGYLIRKAKLTRSFKFLLTIFRFKYMKRVRWGVYIGHLKKKHFRFSLKRRKIRIKWTKKKKNRNKIKKKKYRIKNYYKNIKLNDWKFNFWNKFKNSYFAFSKKKFSKNNLKKFLLKKTVSLWRKMGYLRARLAVYYIKKRSPMRRHPAKKEFKKRKKKLMNRLTWLKVSKIKGKKKTWWLLRVTLKKTAYYYGIKKLQKFRYINNLNNKTMALKSYYNYKLECMLNMVLFRLNLFDNVYISNNFIRVSGILVNNKIVIYPFRFIKVNDIIKFPLNNFKKMFSIFVKRSRFNKSFLLKRLYQKKIKRFDALHLVKNFVNIPQYFEYNYKIMHFVMWRLPNRKELSGAIFKHKNSYDWSLNTQLQYN